MEVLPATNQFNIGFGYDKVSEGVWGSGDALRRRLEEELRAAKGRLAVGEVVVPATLLPSVARACLALAEHEPCGARGATLFLSLRDERLPEPTPLATLKMDHSTVSTFELHLTLHHTAPAWTHLLPHFLKNLAGNGTMVISPQFTLIKKKLYRSYQQD